MALPESLLEEAEQIDSYRKLCNEDPVNRLARRDFSYRAYSVEPLTKWKLPVWLKPIAERSRIVWVNPSTEGGLPHTRPGKQFQLICMPQYFPENRIATTLIHELVHCYQRITPYVFSKIYDMQGWRKATDDDIDRIPDEFFTRIRLNPDTILTGQFWVWKERYMPLPIFQREDKPALNETDIRWLDFNYDYLYRSPPQDFQNYFGPVHDPEHPAEVAAYSLADPATYSKYPAWSTYIPLGVSF